MWAYLLNNPFLVSTITFVVVLMGALVWFRIENARLEKTINYQHEIIKHQEQTIVALEEDIKNAKLKQKHDDVVKSLSNDTLRERMQHEGFYRD